MVALVTAARFGVVGVFTAVLHYGLLLVGVEGLQVSPTLASSVGFVVAVIFNYWMHYHWTFATPTPHGKTLLRYLVMIGCGFWLNAAVMYAGVHWLAWYYLLVQGLALAAVVLWNFSLSSAWVFR